MKLNLGDIVAAISGAAFALALVYHAASDSRQARVDAYNAMTIQEIAAQSRPME